MCAIIPRRRFFLPTNRFIRKTTTINASIRTANGEKQWTQQLKADHRPTAVYERPKKFRAERNGRVNRRIGEALFWITKRGGDRVQANLAEHRQKAQAVAQIRATINKWRQYCESKAGGLTVRLVSGAFVSVALRRSSSLMRR
jgi:hypothetical protein